MATVAEIWRYPVKSMAGERLDEATIGPAGIPGDRAYALIDAQDGKVASAKNPRKWGALLHFNASFVEPPVPGQAAPSARITLPDGRMYRSDDADIDRHLSDAVGRPVRLAASAPEDRSFEEVWPDIEGMAPAEFIEQTTTGRDESGEPVSSIDLGMLAPKGTFFDLTVLHLITTATLAALSRTAPEADFDVRRYRPNLLIDGAPPGFPDNSWPGHTLPIGRDLRVSVVMATMRCVMTTLAQPGLPQDRRTLRALTAANRIELPGLGHWACAGVYADVEQPGTVRVGDEVGRPA